MKAKNNWPYIATDKDDKKAMRKIIEEKKLKNFICIVPDARADKQWPIENFDRLIKEIKQRHPKEQIVLVGSNEEEIGRLADKNPGVVQLLNENLRVVYLLFQKSELVIAHDGGPVHLAWAGRAKTLDLIEKRLPLEWIKPLGKNSYYIYDDLKNLSVENVLKEVEKILKR